MAGKTRARKPSPAGAGGKGDPSGEQIRLSVNMNPATAASLREFAESNGITVTEAVRRLISYGSFVANEHRDGKQVLVKDGDELQRLVLMD